MATPAAEHTTHAARSRRQAPSRRACGNDVRGIPAARAAALRLPSCSRRSARAASGERVLATAGVSRRGRRSTSLRVDAARTRRGVRGAAEDVAQLADVARPVVGGQPRQSRGRELARPDLRCELLEQLARDGRDVAAALAQRRDVHDEALEPVEEVPPELARGHALLEGRVGRGEDPDVAALAASRRRPTRRTS